MDIVDGSGFWLAGTTVAPAAPAVSAGDSFKPIWRPRRRVFWWWVPLWMIALFR